MSKKDLVEPFRTYVYHGPLEVNATVKVTARTKAEAEHRLDAQDFEYIGETVIDCDPFNFEFEGVE